MNEYALVNGEIDGLVQYCSNSSALAVTLLQSCTKPSKYVKSLRANAKAYF